MTYIKFIKLINIIIIIIIYKNFIYNLKVLINN